MFGFLCFVLTCDFPCSILLIVLPASFLHVVLPVSSLLVVFHASILFLIIFGLNNIFFTVTLAYYDRYIHTIFLGFDGKR